MELDRAIVDLQWDDVLSEVRRRIDEGEDPVEIMDSCRKGMVAVGDRYEEGGYFLAELMLAGEIFSESVALLAPHLQKGDSGQAGKGRIVLATPKGDIHDLGKNIVGLMMRAYGFDVHDLGVDVEPSVIVEKVREVHPQFVGLSVLLTTGLSSAKHVADLLAKESGRDSYRLILGGGVTTADARDYVGADFQTKDVMEGIEYCLRTAAEPDRSPAV